MFNLTENELRFSMVCVKYCLAGMGGKRPSDLEYDEYTWLVPGDIAKEGGYAPKQVSGFFSSLMAKGMISEYDKNEWVLETDGWRYLDTVWDEYND